MGPWRLPRTTLHAPERLILEYLTAHAKDCCIERTTKAVICNCFSTRSNASASVSRALRALNMLGLISHNKRYGVNYWDRVKATQEELEEGSDAFVEARVSRFDYLRAPIACSMFRALCFRHPEPMTEAQLCDDVLYGDSRNRVHATLENMREQGIVGSNKGRRAQGAPELWWPTNDSLSMWRQMQNPKFDEDLVVEYLTKNFDRPDLCSSSLVIENALVSAIDGSGLAGLEVRTRNALKRLRYKQIIYTMHDSIGEPVFWRVKGLAIGNKWKGAQKK